MPISPDRRRLALDQVISFEAFVDGAVNHQAELRDAYAGNALTEADRAALAQLTEPVDVLAIVEDWCPDVVANLPIVARLAEASDLLTLHVLVRTDETRDVADAYPSGGRSHIPTYVVSDATGKDLGVIVERTAEVGAASKEYFEGYFARNPQLDRTTFPAGLDDAARAELVAGSVRFRAGLRDLERSTLTRDLIAIATRSSAAPHQDAGTFDVTASPAAATA